MIHRWLTKGISRYLLLPIKLAQETWSLILSPNCITTLMVNQLTINFETLNLTCPLF
jgi:hypothetical protein